MSVAQDTSPDIALGAGARLRFEPFDSAHLGAAAYMLISSPDTTSLRVALNSLKGWLASKPRFALVTARPANAEQESNLGQAGFHKVETSMTFRRSFDDLASQADPRVTFAESADEADCVALGSRAFVTDRFHREPAIPKAAADALKADWVRNSLHGRADRSFVARQGGRPAGFNLCMVRGDTASIDLIAVDSAQRRKGLARALVEASLSHYRERGLARMQVKTQADNAASIALYRQCGFELIEQSAVYHLTPVR